MGVGDNAEALSDGGDLSSWTWPQNSLHADMMICAAANGHTIWRGDGNRPRRAQVGGDGSRGFRPIAFDVAMVAPRVK